MQGSAELEINIMHMEAGIARQQVHLQAALQQFLEQVQVVDAGDVRIHNVGDELEVLQVGLQVSVLPAQQRQQEIVQYCNHIGLALIHAAIALVGGLVLEAGE